ncbi:MAG: SOS response-associated peptidase family protein, partial [Alphaproteobacteria bacterium]|nr:SOS response-associated peptidase family protein [Alphaproteobacteria bacterium]
LLACAMVTVPPNGLIRSITDRMPAVLEAPDWPVWLGETAASPAEAKAVLKVPAGTDWRMAPEKQPSQPSFL